MIRIQNVIHFCNLTRFFRIENMHLCTHTVNTNVAIDQIPDNLHVMVDIGNAVIKVYIINVKLYRIGQIFHCSQETLIWLAIQHQTTIHLIDRLVDLILHL